MSDDWLKRAMKAANITQSDVAKVLAEALKMSEAEVLHRAGLIGSDLPSVPVLGYVDATGAVQWLSEPLTRVVAPVRGSESDVAIEDRSGRSFHGWTLYLSRLAESAPDLSGRLVVAQLRAGASVLRVLSPSARLGVVDLSGDRLGFPTITAADVASARRVVWIKP